ncbi:hypothetical protein APHAL10511_005413 [Amanita phalloides]|nr:hypothetical protein APHAL10511_005413 [Amanita phalloides]
MRCPNEILYIKGYKLDRQKIRAVFKRKDGESEESYDFKWIKPIINSIPETAYSYVGNGLEPHGHLNLVLVLEEGYDEAALKGSLKVLTAGVWPSDEQDDDDR